MTQNFDFPSSSFFPLMRFLCVIISVEFCTPRSKLCLVNSPSSTLKTILQFNEILFIFFHWIYVNFWKGDNWLKIRIMFLVFVVFNILLVIFVVLDFYLWHNSQVLAYTCLSFLLLSFNDTYRCVSHFHVNRKGNCLRWIIFVIFSLNFTGRIYNEIRALTNQVTIQTFSCFIVKTRVEERRKSARANASKIYSCTHCKKKVSICFHLRAAGRCGCGIRLIKNWRC